MLTASLTFLQNGHPSNSYSSMGFRGWVLSHVLPLSKILPFPEPERWRERGGGEGVESERRSVEGRGASKSISMCRAISHVSRENGRGIREQPWIVGCVNKPNDQVGDDQGKNYKQTLPRMRELAGLLACAES